MGGALLRIILYTAVVVLPVAIASFLGESSSSVVHEAAKNMALAGFTILVLQVLLAARVKWIERAFGFDILIRFHKQMAVFAVLLLLAHRLHAPGRSATHLFTGPLFLSRSLFQFPALRLLSLQSLAHQTFSCFLQTGSPTFS